MKNILRTILIVIVISSALGTAGFAGYRLGIKQAALSAPDGDTRPFDGGKFGWGHGDRGKPNFDRGPGFDHGFEIRRHRGGGFGFFFPLHMLATLLFLAFAAWVAYKLFTGWQISFTRAPAASTSAEPAQPVLEPKPGKKKTQGK